MAGNLTIESCGNIFASTSTGASTNYGIGSDGRVGMYVEEKDRSWASSSSANDNQAVTIEVANSSVGGDWPVSDTAYAKLIDLCVDICQRNGISSLTWTGDSNGTLTCHYMFASTECPGPYLKSRMPDIAATVNQRLGGGSSGTDQSTSANTEDLKTEGIRKFQAWLNSNYRSGLTEDGIYGPLTKTAAIKALQTNIGVTADGIWGANSKAACPTLAQGSSGSDVYILQGMLYCRGYVYSGFDGQYGAMTVSEVKSYQGANSLSVDGMAGKNTFTSLFA